MGLSGSKSTDAIRGSLGEVWIEDKLREQCFNCHAPFNTRVRRHHCRCCGEVFCKDCWGTRVDLPAGLFHDVAAASCCRQPVCHVCSTILALGTSAEALWGPEGVPIYVALASTKHTGVTAPAPAHRGFGSGGRSSGGGPSSSPSTHRRVISPGRGGTEPAPVVNVTAGSSSAAAAAQPPRPAADVPAGPIYTMRLERWRPFSRVTCLSFERLDESPSNVAAAAEAVAAECTPPLSPHRRLAAPSSNGGTSEASDDGGAALCSSFSRQGGPPRRPRSLSRALREGPSGGVGRGDDGDLSASGTSPAALYASGGTGDYLRNPLAQGSRGSCRVVTEEAVGGKSTAGTEEVLDWPQRWETPFANLLSVSAAAAGQVRDEFTKQSGDLPASMKGIASGTVGVRLETKLDDVLLIPVARPPRVPPKPPKASGAGGSGGGGRASSTRFSSCSKGALLAREDDDEDGATMRTIERRPASPAESAVLSRELGAAINAVVKLSRKRSVVRVSQPGKP